MMTLKSVTLALLLVAMGQIDPPPRQFPNEPPEYADGVFCTPKGDLYKGFQTPDHPCACHNMMREDKDGCCDVKVTNDPVCKQFCHEQMCACPIMCIPGQPDETETPGEPPPLD